MIVMKKIVRNAQSCLCMLHLIAVTIRRDIGGGTRIIASRSISIGGNGIGSGSVHWLVFAETARFCVQCTELGTLGAESIGQSHRLYATRSGRGQEFR